MVRRELQGNLPAAKDVFVCHGRVKIPISMATDLISKPQTQASELPFIDILGDQWNQNYRKKNLSERRRFGTFKDSLIIWSLYIFLVYPVRWGLGNLANGDISFFSCAFSCGFTLETSSPTLSACELAGNFNGRSMTQKNCERWNNALRLPRICLLTHEGPAKWTPTN